MGRWQENIPNEFTVGQHSRWYQYESGYLCAGYSKPDFASIPIAAVHNIQVLFKYYNFHSYGLFMRGSCF